MSVYPVEQFNADLMQQFKECKCNKN